MNAKKQLAALADFMKTVESHRSVVHETTPVKLKKRTKRKVITLKKRICRKRPKRKIALRIPPRLVKRGAKKASSLIEDKPVVIGESLHHAWARHLMGTLLVP